jgi:membrane protein YdbS with pleckstrin-like domain
MLRQYNEDEEENKKIREENSGCLVTLLVWVLLITVGFGIVVGIFAIMYYVENGPLIVGFVLFAIIMGVIHVWMDSQW